MDAPLAGRIRALELELLDPGVRASAARLDALLDDDFVEIGASGRVYDRAAVLDALPREPARTLHVEGFGVTPLAPGVVLATYRVRDGNVQSLRSSIWRDAGERGWRLAFHQGTPAAPGSG